MAASIKDLDRKNFLAYSQHYGLPTSLVDITLSPLISLYFSCSNEPEEDGFIYIFNKKETIDISEIVLENPYINGEHLSFEKGSQFIIYIMDQMHSEVFFPVEKLFINLITFIKKNTITPAYENIYSRNIQSLIQSSEVEGAEARELTAKWICLFEDNQSLQSEFLLFIESLKDSLPISDKYHWIHKLKHSKTPLAILSTAGFLEEHEKHILWYFFILSELIYSYKHTNFDHSDDFDLDLIVINFLPIFTYQAITNFNRIKAQNGEFIFQMALKLNINTHLLQKLNPSVQIKIDKHAKESIMNDLDMMGINKKNLFGDPDSISMYLKDKYIYEAYKQSDNR